MNRFVNDLAAKLHKALWRDGGGTVDPQTGELTNYETGFFVSLRKYTRKFEGWASLSDIEAWLESAISVLDCYPNQLFPGVWYDRETHSVWCDLSQLVIEESAALSLGAREGQLAIRDNRHRTDVYLHRFAEKVA